MRKLPQLTRSQRDGLVKVIDVFMEGMETATSRAAFNLAWDTMLLVVELTLGFIPSDLTLDNLVTFRDNLAKSGVIEDN